MNPFSKLPQHTKDEMLQTLAWELTFGSMDPEYCERTIHSLIDAGAHFANERQANL